MNEIKNSSWIVSNKLNDPFLFEEILAKRNEINLEVKSLDLSKIQFIEPYSMLSMVLLGKNFLNDNGEKLNLINIPIHIHQYLDRMNFFKIGVFNIVEELSEKYLYNRSSQSKRLIEITEIPNKEVESIAVITAIIKLFRSRAASILKYWLSGPIIDLFITVISELCQNIFEHSLDSGYFTIQTYSRGNENVVKLVISDSGIGIRKSFENRGIPFENSAELIKMALTTPISSKREFGYGLCQVNNIVERLKGTIFIRSENASVVAFYKKKKKDSNYIFYKNNLSDFNGTQISITLSS